MGLPTVALSESLFGGLTQDYSALTNCQNGKEIEEEFSKLFKVIKSDILGEKPKFCEAYKKHTLNKQINEQSNEFDKFMKMLSSLPANNKSERNPLSLEEMDHERIFFEVAKMVAIKKHWSFVNEAERDELYLKESCAQSQINKFPLTEQKYKSQYEGKDFKPNFMVESLCEAKSIDDILVSLDKDIVAETFLNLKQMFPRDYSKFTDYFCLKVMEKPNALSLNFNSNSIKNTKDLIVSSENFAQWMKDSFRTIASKEERAKNLELIRSASTKTVMQDQGKGLSTGLQEKYKNIYEQKKPNEKAIDPSNPDFEIVKNSKNMYVAKKISDEASKKFIEKIEKSSNEVFFKYIESIKNKEAQISNVTFITKGKKIEFKIDKDKEDALLASIESSFEGANKTKAFTKKYHDSIEGQIFLEQIYKEYMNPADKDDMLYPGENPIFINAQGKYEKKEEPYLSAEVFKKEYDKYAAYINPLKVGKYEVIAGQNGSFYVKKENGEYITTFLKEIDKSGNLSSEAYEPDEEDEHSIGYKDPKVVRDLREALSTNYQKSNKILQKMTKLSSDELAAIRLYTGNEYQSINSCLRKDDCADTLEAKAKNLKSALSQLSEKDKTQVLYRGVSRLPDDLLEKLNKNEKIVVDKGFMSTSGDLEVASNFASMHKEEKGIILMLKTRSCVGISALSFFQGEDEFLCPPGLRFQAKRIKDTNQYVLEEVEK